MLVSGCNVLRFVPKGKSLVERNRVKVEGNEKIENIKDQILLQPNRKMLGVVKFNLWAYYFGQNFFRRDSVTGRIVNREGEKKVVTRGRKVNKVKRFITETVGEKPVYLDSVLVKRSEKNIKNYLYNKGYYDSKISSRVKTIFKRSYVTYYVNPGSPYILRKVVYNGSDIVLDKKANEFLPKTILKVGDKVDMDELSKERDRLTTAYRNDGFYYFNKSFIDIVVDTGGHDRGAEINYNITNPGGLRNARQQIIHKVVVEMNFKQRFGRRDTIKFKSIQYLFRGYDIKPNIINRSIRLRPGDLFSQTYLEATYKKLIGLGLFNQVNIKVLPYKSDTTNRLLIFISLTPMAKHDLIIEPQTITSDKQTDLGSGDNNPRNYGLANTVTLNNKNVFRNAEDLNVKWRVAAEKQFGKGAGGAEVIIFRKKFIAANFETNLTFELLFPKLVGIHRLDTNPKLQQNRTSLNLTLLTEINSNYYRRSIPINYTWQTLYETPDKQSFNIYYSPIQLSFNNSKIHPSFLKGLNARDSLRLVNTFRSYIIPSQKLAIFYTNRNKKPTRYWNIRSNVFELSGNLMELGYRIFKKDNSRDKTMFGIPYFQYFRTEVDAVRNILFAKNKTLLFRVNTGFGLPYGNSDIIPFERQFFVGGSNSLRGWRPRVVGPGEYSDEGGVQVDKTGDMMIATNTEYRFAVAPGFLYGAFFIDAGNIWQITKGATPETKFKLNNFYKQLAVNTGIGMRFDMTFFIIRLDWGIPLHDPSELKPDRWVINDIFSKKRWIFDRTVLNVAVGYPF